MHAVESYLFIYVEVCKKLNLTVYLNRNARSEILPVYLNRYARS